MPGSTQSRQPSFSTKRPKPQRVVVKVYERDRSVRSHAVTLYNTTAAAVFKALRPILSPGEKPKRNK